MSCSENNAENSSFKCILQYSLDVVSWILNKILNIFLIETFVKEIKPTGCKDSKKKEKCDNNICHFMRKILREKTPKLSKDIKGELFDVSLGYQQYKYSQKGEFPEKFG